MTAHKSSRNKLSVRLNERVVTHPVVSRLVVDEYVGRTDEKWQIEVTHRCRLPVGAGYGTSGASAASLSLALNERLGNHLSSTDALRIAHVADVEAKTGLGTVASVSIGGLAVRVEPGAPGVGRVMRLPTPSNLRVVSGSFGPMSKPRVLSSATLAQRINICGRRLTGKLLNTPDASSFVSLSRGFSDCLGLSSSRLRRVLDILDGRKVAASMMMLGDGAFCILPKNSARTVGRLFQRAGMSVVISKIGRRGAHVL